MTMTRETRFGEFRDFAAESVIGDDNVQIYSLSLHSSSSDCGEDCHSVEAYIVDEDLTISLGEVSDGRDDDNTEIAERLEAAGYSV